MYEFDPLHCPLKGITLIEASAGTGKTYNICLLYLRLIIEQNLAPEEILVLTFTKAACSELRQRIKNYLLLFLNKLEKRKFFREEKVFYQHDLLDLYISELYQKKLSFQGDNDKYDLMIESVRDVIASFDQASIYTIHGFCQKLLTDKIFDKIVVGQFEVVNDDLYLRRTLAGKFWVEKIEPILCESEEFAAWILKSGLGPNALADLLEDRLQNQDGILISEKVEKGSITCSSILEKPVHCKKLYDKLSELWDIFANEAYSMLTNQAVLSLPSNIYKLDIINRSFNSWNRYLKYNFHWMNTSDLYKKGVKAELLSSSFIKDKVLKGKNFSLHFIFFVIHKMLVLLDEADLFFHFKWLKICERWLISAPQNLRALKNQSFQLTFDDLLRKVNLGLSEKNNFGKLIRKRFPAALIDEFQDTDRTQYEIIKHIYAKKLANTKVSVLPAENCLEELSECRDFSLFLFGDPKQSIYAFRGADIYSYFSAKKNADQIFTLTSNWRANLPLIEANNYLFSLNSQVFIEKNLKFSKAKYRNNLFFEYNDDDIRGTSLKNKAANEGYLDKNAGNLLHIWLLPYEKNQDSIYTSTKKQFLLNRKDAIYVSAIAVVDEVCRLLNQNINECAVSTEKFSPSEIAILVRTNRQGYLMHDLLKKKGINTFSLFKVSIFSTEEAKNIELMLQAISKPNDLVKIKSALLSPWINIDFEKLRTGQITEQLLSYVSIFSELHNIYKKRGFISMWFSMFEFFDLNKNIIVNQKANRQIANFIHLGELLCQAFHNLGSFGVTLEQLINWLNKKIKKSKRGEDLLRPECSGDYVKVMTIHQAKGQEFPVVFCPFLFDMLPGEEKNLSLSKKKHLLNLFNFRNNEKTYQCLARSIYEAYQKLRHSGIGLFDEKIICRDYLDRVAYLDQLAENVRLIYVAMTRATKRSYLIAGIFSRGGNHSTTASCKSSLNWLIHDNLDNILSTDEIISRWMRLESDSIYVKTLFNLQSENIFYRDMKIQSLSNLVNTDFSKIKYEEIPPSWHINSFTKLVDSQRLFLDRDGIDKSFDMESEAYTFDSSSLAVKESNELSLTFLPSGVAAGILMHQLYEKIFSSSIEQWSFVVSDILKNFEYQWRIFVQSNSEKHAWKDFTTHGWIDRWHPIFFEHVKSIASYNLKVIDDDRSKLSHEENNLLPDSFRLQDLTRNDIVVEFPFTLYFRGGEKFFHDDSQAYSRDQLVKALLDNFSYSCFTKKSFSRICSGVDGGFVKGVIDLIFSHNQRYYFIDWKTNKVVPKINENMNDAINLVMNEQGYWLQGILYSLALHRYLKSIYSDYDYEKHFGGMYFIFVRYLINDSSTDVKNLNTSQFLMQREKIEKNSEFIVMHRPPFLLIDGLDKLFLP